MFVNDILSNLGYYAFQGKTANGIIEQIRFDKKCWITLHETPTAINTLIVAGRIGDPHGHVNILLTGEPVMSGKWNKVVPQCANIGKDNYWMKGVNYSFKIEPEYFQFQG
jgi:hypothetical protein